MDSKAKSDLGKLLVDQDKLLEVFSKNINSLDEYPDLQRYLSEKTDNVKAFKKAIKTGTFTRDEMLDEIGERLNMIAYELRPKIEMNFLLERVAMLVGDDIDKVKTLQIEDFGTDTLSKLLHAIGNAAYQSQQTIKSYPWRAERGRGDKQFYAKLDEVYKAWQEGYSSHYKLNTWCQTNLDMKCPQSVPRFFKSNGNPSEIQDWVDWVGEYKSS
ncbi:hypothetical protein [Vibrio sp. SCSIO 43136]|uniref:hypothetical protein n=1 Tax=Vibrio sp. SCSIO 43136 TaxID=2819101 RepID=UPI0020765C0E|nr:hypothetical protein [Vibrio sp. SCSIO 43136]USD66914.1 hypothetical protein J4N39_19910 [Vibrio sp. SCSIO 43136]